MVTPPTSPDISATVVPGGKDGRYWRTANKKMHEIQGVAKRNEEDKNRLDEALLDLSVSTNTLQYTSVAP
jgi:hypothetical protein